MPVVTDRAVEREVTFLNVDLELVGTFDRPTLLRGFGRAVIVLFNGRSPTKGHLLSLELARAHKATLERRLRAWVRIVRALPPAARRAWTAAKQHTLDIGIQAGLGPHQSTWALPADVLSELGALGVTVVLTVYGAKVSATPKPERFPPPGDATGDCHCNILRWVAAQRGSNLVFDDKLREYHLTHADDGYSVLWRCPWCGGSLPESKRASGFTRIPAKELGRLRKLTAGVTTIREAIRKFGTPDSDTADGASLRRPSGATVTFRCLEYRGLSTTATVTLTDYGRNGVVFDFRGRSRRQASR